MPIQFDFRDRRVFVTDAAAGLGRCIAGAFHDLGAKVAIHGPSEAAIAASIRDLGGGPRLIAAPGDLATTANVAAVVGGAITALGGLDVLVCCATEASLCDLEHIDEANFTRVMSVNTKKALFVTQASVPALRATRGAVVYVASTIGLVGGPRGAVGYATASGATIQMARMTALELASDGIRVNAVCPAWVDADDAATASVFDSFIRKRSPLGRLEKPDEIAAAVLYLAAPFAGYTTGSTLVADGAIASGHYVA